MKQKSTKRIFLLTLAVVLLVLTLTGCGSNNVQKLTLPDTITPVEGGNLTADQLKLDATLLVSVYNAKSYNTQDYLIAASRGYDMLAEGFDDSTVDPTKTGAGDPVTLAVKVLDAANEKAADKDKIGKSNYENMNEADLGRLVALFQTKVDTTATSGFFDKLQRGVGIVLNWITTYLGFGSYLVGICIFAILVEILMLPLAVRQQKNSIKQARLRPKEMAIRNKYKGRNDQVTQQKIQQELQELYQRENFSQLSGCLPLLIQLPILFMLYNIVVDPLHYVLGQSSGISNALYQFATSARAAGGLGEALRSSRGSIELLSGGIERFSGIQNFAYFSNGGEVWESVQNIAKLPNFNLFGFNLGLTPSWSRIDILLLIPLLTFVVYFFSMRLTRKFTYQPMQQGAVDRQTACSNNIMDVSMPLMSTVFTFWVPGVVGIYWIFRSILGTLKQFIMSRVMPLPQFTEEDYKAAAREMAGKKPKVQKSENAGKVRSLHHIDDEDFDDTRERAMKQKEAIAEREREEQEKKAKATPFGAVSMKEDRKKNRKEEKTEEKPEEMPEEKPEDEPIDTSDVAVEETILESNETSDPEQND